MRFSVIVPIFKTEQYLEECVEHLLNQTFRDFELILVDDGSPDRCPEMVDYYAARDPRVRPLHKPNGGLVSARKAGAAVAQGEYVLNVDSDDYVSEDLLERVDAAIAAHRPDAVFFGMTLFGTAVETQQFGYPLAAGFYGPERMEELRASFLYDNKAPRMNFGNILSPICSKAVRRELYLSCQQRVPDAVRSGEDMLFTMHLLNRAESVVSLEHYGYFYRQIPESMEHTVTERDFENLHILYTELEEGMGARKNQIAAYMFSRVWAFSVRLARTVGYGAFIKRMKDPNLKKLFPVLRGVVIAAPSFKDRIVLVLLKRRMLLPIYLLANTVFKNKNI